jgi:hypothetical protein
MDEKISAWDPHGLERERLESGGHVSWTVVRLLCACQCGCGGYFASRLRSSGEEGRDPRGSGPWLASWWAVQPWTVIRWKTLGSRARPVDCAHVASAGGRWWAGVWWVTTL